MSTRVRIAFATCPPQVPVLQQLATSFASVAEVHAFNCRGEEADAVLPALAAMAPHVVVTGPSATTYLGERLRTAVLPFEVSPDGLAPTIDEALAVADTVGVFLLAGTASPLVTRFLKRTAGTVHLFIWESVTHLQDLILRAKRMGVRVAVGGGTVATLAEQEGLRGICFYGRPEDPVGVLGQLIVKAAAQAALRVVSRREELIAYGLILEKIMQGAIEPHDTVLHVDPRGLVTAAFTPLIVNGAGRAPAPALPAGISVMEAVAACTTHAASDSALQASPLALDLYPLAAAGADGSLVVIRGSRRPAGVLPGDTRTAGLEAEHVETLLQRLDTLLERTEALTQARHPRTAARRFLASLRRRQFLLDWHRVRYFELRSGLVFAEMIDGQSFATNYTIADILARVDPRDFFRIHRHVVVNLTYVTEVERYGQGQLRLIVEGPDATTTMLLASRPASAALRKLLKL